MDKLLLKLDLQEYTKSFEAYLARQKPLFMEGDVHLHYKLIKELFNHQSIKPVPVMINLDRAISVLQKNGVLILQEIYAFVKIINYFKYLQKNFIENSLGKWMDKIQIEQTFLDICAYFTDKGELKSNLDEDFESIEKSLKHIKEDMSMTLKRTMSSQKLGTYLVDRQVHYINNQEAILVRGGFNHVIKGSVIGRSSNGFFYVTPDSISKLKSKQSDLQTKKEVLIYKYCKDISSSFSKSLFFLKFINKEFDRFDAYAARVSFAKSKDMEFVLPKKDSIIKLAKFSHPALSEPKPISIDFSKQVLMITGVNAGGKTMLLKSILSSALMAKYLLPMRIDSSKSSIGSFKEIYTILDDPQNVKNDISTFAGRMSRFAGLFNKKSTLLGVDEIELGTDADEAASLFKVLIEKLIEKNMKIVITTHHKRLASLLATNEHVELLAAIYDEKNQKPTFGFLQGTIGKSYAFETALRYGIPATLIREAREIYGDDKEKLNDLIQKNIDLELKMRAQSEDLNHKLEEIEKSKINLEDAKEKNQEDFDKLKYEMSLEYNKAIKEAKDAIKTKDSKEAHRHLNKAHEHKKSTQQSTVNTKPLPLSVGDFVKYGNSKGVIRSLNKDMAMIECDGISMRVPSNRLKRSGNSHKKLKKQKVTINTKVDSNSTILLDLHGLRSEEAVQRLDKFISDALINGYEELRVYHGIGTGKLAYAVREFLKTHPCVERYEDAPPNQGGFGATIVKL